MGSRTRRRPRSTIRRSWRRSRIRSGASGTRRSGRPERSPRGVVAHQESLAPPPPLSPPPPSNEESDEDEESLDDDQSPDEDDDESEIHTGPLPPLLAAPPRAAARLPFRIPRTITMTRQ